MGRMYVAPISAVSVSAICELFVIMAPNDAAVIIHEIFISQDTQEISEQLPLSIFRTATDQSAKGTSITPAPLHSGDAAFGGTVRSNILTAATFATVTTLLMIQSQNILNGWHILPTPECRIILSPGVATTTTGANLVIKLDTAPSVALPISGYVVFEEIGG
jgi:hypothetical protein